MTIIGAPQCRQMKTGRASMMASSGDGLIGCDVQQFAHLCEIGTAHLVGEQPEVADPMETTGQHMEQEAAHEFAGFEGVSVG